jgi:glycosyltransferase involved in cell wall biosynthesis
MRSSSERGEGREQAAARPRLVFVNRFFHPDHSATSQILSDLAFRVAALGADVHIVCSTQRYDDPRARLPRAELVRGVQVHRLGGTRFGRSRLAGRALDDLCFHAGAAWRLIRLLRRGDIVVAKTDPPLIALAAAAAAALRSARLVNWMQDVYPEVASHLGANPLPRWADALLRRVRDATLRAAAANVVLGVRMRDRVRELGVAPERVAVIENWSDGVAPLPGGQSRLRAAVGGQDRFVVAYSGNLGRAHETGTMLGALGLLRDDARFLFLFIGDGAGMRELRDAAEHGGFEHARFLPYQPRESLSDALAAADVHLAILRPELEGLIVPSKAYGVLAAGRPLVFIGDADGEIPRLLRSAGCGGTVAPGDSAGLVRTLEALRADPAATAAMGLRARRLFTERCTVERALRQWTEVLERVEPRVLCRPEALPSAA